MSIEDRQDIDEDGPDRISAVEVLGFLAKALGGLPHRIGRIEALAAPLARSTSLADEPRIALQDLDHIRQTVEDLARLAAEAGTRESHSTVALASTLRLEALRNLLAGSGQDVMTEPKAETDRGRAGRIEFFAGGLDGD